MNHPHLKFELALASVLEQDPELAQEVQARRSDRTAQARTKRLWRALEGYPDATCATAGAALDYACVARPVLPVAYDGPRRPKRPSAGSATWLRRLVEAGDKVRTAIKAVGRIEVRGNGDLTVAGTGFLVADDVIATNQHVAAQFSEMGEDGFVFRLNLGDELMKASIDFREEDRTKQSLEFRIVEVLHLEMDVSPDIAFLRVARTSRRRPLPEPLEFFMGEVRERQAVVAIGYPQKDTRVKHAALKRRIFGNIFDKKRVSPGRIRRIEGRRVVHDCSVLRGNSGCPLVCLETGKVVGIHTMGEFLEDNFAVAARTADAALRRVLRAKATDDAPRAAVVEPPPAAVHPAPSPRIHLVSGTAAA